MGCIKKYCHFSEQRQSSHLYFQVFFSLFPDIRLKYPLHFSIFSTSNQLCSRFILYTHLHPLFPTHIVCCWNQLHNALQHINAPLKIAVRMEKNEFLWKCIDYYRQRNQLRAKNMSEWTWRENIKTPFIQHFWDILNASITK